MSAKGKISVGSLLSSVLLVLAVVGLIGFAATFTANFTSDFKTFYVEYNGKMVLEKLDNVKLSSDTQHRFDCKYTFEIFNKEELKGYNLKIVPNVESGNDFEFSIDGSYYSFGAAKDLTAGFDIERHEDYFIVKPIKEMKQILLATYGGQNISMPDIEYSCDYFTLIISSYNDKASVHIGFRPHIAVKGISINEGNILI